MNQAGKSERRDSVNTDLGLEGTRPLGDVGGQNGWRMERKGSFQWERSMGGGHVEDS